MKEIKYYKTSDGKKFDTVKEAIEYKTGRKIKGEIVDYYIYDSGVWKYIDYEGLHIFAPDGTELTKNAVGSILCWVFYNDTGAWGYEDDKGVHLFAPDGTELTKGTKGEVAHCDFHDNGTWEYTDDKGIHRGQWKAKEKS